MNEERDWLRSLVEDTDRNICIKISWGSELEMDRERAWIGFQVPFVVGLGVTRRGVWFWWESDGCCSSCGSIAVVVVVVGVGCCSIAGELLSRGLRLLNGHGWDPILVEGVASAGAVGWWRMCELILRFRSSPLRGGSGPGVSSSDSEEAVEEGEEG
jgi:hypothetical protein